MWLRVEHTTSFTYDAPDRRGVHGAAPEARSSAAASAARRSGSRPSRAALRSREYRDHFGNAVQHFDVLEPHDRLAVTARSEV